ncbi:MAG TPA: hypothetical protein ENJ82_13105, partial [Bacteroidetes bacterium]|nr:hypothetical protein [Bacteroidota bacterium]
KDELRLIPIGYFDDVLNKQPLTRIYRPSLYDLLAHQALAIFQNDLLYLSKPAYQFQIEGKAAFGSEAEFLAENYESRDSASFKLIALKLYQELSRLHKDDETADARIIIALERLKFVRDNSVLPEKETAYIQALETLEKKYNSNSASTQISYAAATWYHGQAGKYLPQDKDQKHKKDNQTALRLCKEAMRRFPESEGAGLCKVLKLEIEHKSLDVKCETINLPGVPFRSLVSYRNLEKVWFRVVKVTEKERDAYQNINHEALLPKLIKRTAIKSWAVDLPKDQDYNPHLVELAMPAMDNGYYAILTSDNAQFSFDKHAVALTFTWCSRLAYASRSLDNEELEVFLFDRETGSPLPFVTCNIYIQKYNYDQRKHTYHKGKSYQSDKDGYIRIPAPSKNSNSFYLGFYYEGQQIRTNDSWYLYKGNHAVDRHSKQTIFFTDRGIYRPGQTVYFKGIVLDRFKDKSSIIPNYTSNITFNDANYQAINSISLTTNEFGTFQGTFVIPKGLMNGQFTLSGDHGSVSISVEDYKRPKFEVTFDPLKGSFKLGEKVKVTGKAMAYAGANIDGAEVKYRVVRTASFPYWGYWTWGRMMPNSPEMEIGSGSAKTDEKGVFEVEFSAIPDKEISAELKPQFAYTVQVDVVDITGETHSASQSVNVGYLALHADLAMPEAVEASHKDGFAIVTRNLNGQFEAAKGKITVHKLVSPNQVFRDRLWEMPDKFVMTQAEFYAKFPRDVYKDENDYHTWKKEREVFNTAFDSQKEDT